MRGNEDPPQSSYPVLQSLVQGSVDLTGAWMCFQSRPRQLIVAPSARP
jgi:hypothetical protein